MFILTMGMVTQVCTLDEIHQSICLNVQLKILIFCTVPSRLKFCVTEHVTSQRADQIDH